MDSSYFISKDESPKLDFKREWYPKEKLKNEFVKDIIALTNGSPDTIGKIAYLVIGVTGKNNSVYDFNKNDFDNIPSLKKKLMDILIDYITPDISSFELEWSDDKKIIIIKISAHDALFSLSRDIKIKESFYKKGTCFYRIGESNSVASPDVIGRFHTGYKDFPNTKEKYENIYRILQIKKDVVFIIYESICSRNFFQYLPYINKELVKFSCKEVYSRVSKDIAESNDYTDSMNKEVDRLLQINFNNLIDLKNAMDNAFKIFNEQSIFMINNGRDFISPNELFSPKFNNEDLLVEYKIIYDKLLDSINTFLIYLK